MHYLAVLIILVLFVRVHGTLKGNSSRSQKEADSETMIGHMTVNSEAFMIYDRETHSYSYNFRPFELLRAHCQAASGWTIRMEYWWISLNGTKETVRYGMSQVNKTATSAERKYPVMYRKMQYKTAGQGLICEIIHKGLKLKYKIKVTLNNKYTTEKAATLQEPAVFVVNDLALYPRPTQYKALKFIYEYYSREKLRVSLKINRTMYRIVNCSFTSRKRPNTFSLQDEFIIFSLDEKHDNVAFSCTLQSAMHRIINAMIVFLHDAFIYEPYIIGTSISESRILQKYTVNSTATVIEYETSHTNKLSIASVSDCYADVLAMEYDPKLFRHHDYNYVRRNKHGEKLVNKIESSFVISPQVTRTLITYKLLRNGNNSTVILYYVNKDKLQDELYEPSLSGRIYKVVNMTAAFRHSHISKGSEIENPETEFEYFEDIVKHRQYAASTGTTAPVGTTGTDGTLGSTATSASYLEETSRCESGQHDGTGDVSTIYSRIIAIITIVFLCVIIGIVMTVCIIRARRKKQTGPVYENAIVRVDLNEDRASVASSHIYETIPEDGDLRDPGVHHPSTYTNTGDSNVAERNISERPPQPQPEEENEENKPYIHYDTPYEFRIFRIGVPVVVTPDRFRSRRSELIN